MDIIYDLRNHQTEKDTHDRNHHKCGRSFLHHKGS